MRKDAEKTNQSETAAHCTSEDTGTTGSASPAGRNDRMINNWRFCEAYERAMRENLLHCSPDRLWLSKRYGVAPYYISRWRAGTPPKSIKTYRLSQDPEIHTRSVNCLMDKHDLSAHAVRTTLRVLGIKPVTTEFVNKIHQRVAATCLAGKKSDPVVAEMAGCSVSAVRNYRRKNDIPPYRRKTKSMEDDATFPKELLVPMELGWRAKALQKWGVA